MNFEKFVCTHEFYRFLKKNYGQNSCVKINFFKIKEQKTRFSKVNDFKKHLNMFLRAFFSKTQS